MMTALPHYCFEDRVTFQAQSGQLSGKLLRESNQREIELVRGGTAPVHHLVHVKGQISIDLNLKQMAEVMTFLQEPNLGWIVLVSTDPVATFLASVLAQARRVNFKAVKSLEEAWGALQDVDPTLADIPSPFDSPHTE